MGKQSVGGEGDDGDARGALAQPGQGQQKAEHGERRNGLQDVGDAENGWPSAARVSTRCRGNGDARGEQHGCAGEPEVLDGERGDLAAVLREEAV